MSNEKLMQSANFKKDYITALAVGLFILTFAGEIFIAFSIPIAINHTALYAELGIRQKLISMFDYVRGYASWGNKYPNHVVAMEKRLIRTDLDFLSSHLREYSRTMPMEDVENVLADLQQYNNIIAKLNVEAPKPFCKSETLDFKNTVSRIEKKLDTPPVSQNIKQQGKK